jgi:putative addiction module CopG family antidote
MTLSVSLPAELESRVRAHVASDLYGSASEVIREALRLFEAHQSVQQSSIAALNLLQSRADPCEIALWLGHESPSTTHMYVEADLAMKERALARLGSPETKPARYRPPKALMQFLQAL